MRRDAEIGNVAAACGLLPTFDDLEIERPEAGHLRVECRVRWFPELNRRRPIRERISEQSRRSRIDHRKLGSIGTELPCEPVEHHVVRGALCCSDVLAFQILDALNFPSRSYDASPIVEQVE